MKKVHGVDVVGFKIPTFVQNDQRQKENADKSLGGNELKIRELADQEVDFSYLRQRLEAISKIKNDTGIESQAAMPIEPFTWAALIAAGAAGYEAAKRLYNNWIRSSQKSEVDNSVVRAIESLGEHFSDKLLATVPPTQKEVRSAVEKIATAEISDASDILEKVKTALVKLVTSEQHSNADLDSQNNSKRTARGFALALEGICSRADINSEKVVEVCDEYINLLKEPSGKYPLLDEAAKESMRLLFVRNWKVPVKDYKVPSQVRIKEYRLGLYQVMYATAADTSCDFLYLRTPMSQVPSSLQEKAKEFRDALVVEAHEYEVNLHKMDIGNYSKPVVDEIEKILTLSPEISQSKWSQKARDQEKIAQENQRRLTALKAWAMPATYMSEADLQTSFEQMALQNQELVEGLDEFRNLYLTDSFATEDKLNEQLTRVLDLTGLDSKVNNAKLTEKSFEKGHFFFRYLNHWIEKKITVGDTRKGPLKNYLSATNRDRILRICQVVVNDKTNFPSTTRNYSFYTKPELTSVPGQALSLHHKLTKCFKPDGYIDVHGLEPLVIENVLHNLSPSGSENEKVAGGFVFSGPAGTGKSSFADALAGQMALPIFKLDGSTVKAGKMGGVITYESRKITTGEFFDIVRANMPCVLLLDDVDQYLIPRKADAGWEREPSPEETELTSSFLEPIQKLRDQRGASKVILIATTNLPTSSNINIALIDEKGECAGAKQELFKHISSTAFRDGRFDYPVFSFHKLYNADQGKAFAIAFFKPLEDLGRLTGTVDYDELGNIAKDYTPATLEKVIATLLPKLESQITITQLLDTLKKQTDRFFASADPELIEDIKSLVHVLSKNGSKKKSGGEFNFYELALAATGLNYKQIKTAIEDLTPEVLTQQNILDAFEKVKQQP